MLGYVTIEKNELKLREYDVYQAYYCGICKSIGRRYGQMPRMVLSYDAVFLAILLSALSEDKDIILQEHCIVHPIKKKPVAFDNEAVDYAADIMVILAYHKFLDDWKDEKSKTGFAAKTALTGTYRKLRLHYEKQCGEIEAALDRLSSLEKASCGSLDLVCDCFAQVMEVLFTGFDLPTKEQRILSALGKALGKWIYTIDAFDDYREDSEKKQYNPLIYRTNHLEGIEDLLYNNLAEVVNAYDLLEIKKNKGILDNIIFLGLRARTDAVSEERNRENEQSI